MPDPFAHITSPRGPRASPEPPEPLTAAELARYLVTVERITATIHAAGVDLCRRRRQRTDLAMATLRAELSLTMLVASVRAAAAAPDDPPLTLPVHFQSHEMCVAGPGEPGHQNPVVLPAWADGVVPEPPTPDEIPVHRPNRSQRHLVEPEPVTIPVGPVADADGLIPGLGGPAGGSALVDAGGPGRTSKRRRPAGR